jgi:putative ABC transport system permease protein
MKLFHRLILRPLRRDLLRTALTILAVALGVAVIVAIDLASDAATGSFRSSVETLAGKTDLEILANGGIEERWFATLATLPINARFSPVVVAQAEIPGIGFVPLYGVDLLGDDHLLLPPSIFRDPATVVIAGRAHQFHVKPIHSAPGEYAVLDIATAQEALGRFGRLDRIDVTVLPGEDLSRVEAAIRAVVPGSFLIHRPGTRSEENQRMLRAFRWNLRVLSYISLVVGAFLIYNTIAVSVVRRRAEIGILRAIGAARATIFRLFLGEALLLGVIGGAVGVLLGRLLASAAVGLIAGTVNALYTTSRPAAVALGAGEAVAGVLIGAVAALVSALAPAREAMAVVPTEAMARGGHEHRGNLRWRRSLVWAALSAAAAAMASQAPPLGDNPAGGYVAALLAIAAMAFAAPAAVLAANRIGKPALARQAQTLLAGRSLAASLSRTSVVVAALATAIAMMASVGIMVGSFRETVALWLNVQLRADLYIRPAVASAAGDYPPLDAAVSAIAAAAPGVAAVDEFRAVEMHFRGGRATLGAGNMEIVRRFGRLRFLPGENREAVLASLPGQDRAIVSEPFANRFGVRAGEVLRVPIGDRVAELTVAGIYYEYSSSQGYMMLDSSTFLKYVPGQRPTSLAVYLSPGADAARAQHEIQTRAAGLGAAVAPNAELRRNAIAIFDRTFAITWALEAVAIVVAMLGAANSLLALVLDRRREFALLRFLGASTRQIRGMVLTEAALAGALAIGLGLALGFALSLLLIFVVNRQSFGWTIQFHTPGVLLSGALALVWVVTVLAAFYPARIAAKLDPIEAIHEE